MKKDYRLLGIICLFAALIGLSACHTVAGIGDDLRAGGNAIRKAAD